MTKMQRIKEVLVGLLMVLVGVAFCIAPSISYSFITALLCLGLTFRGISLLIFYFRMARFMVDGRSLLYQAVIMIDLGLFSGSLTQVPLVYVMMYLVAIYMFTGAIDILRANEARKYGSAWKMKFVSGAIDILIAIVCLVFIKVTSVAVMIYAIGLAYNGIMRIVQAFRKTSMVYIQ